MFHGLGEEECIWIIDHIVLRSIVDDRIFTTSFRCRLDENMQDRIIAIPDGALVLVTNKKSNPSSKLI